MSRELDYRIAKEILDLDCLKDPPYGILIPVEAQVKHYSTSYADSLPLIEQYQYTISKSETSYSVTLYHPIFQGKGNTLPLAICNTLLSMGTSPDEE